MHRAGEGIREGFLEGVAPEDQVEINQKTNGGRASRWGWGWEQRCEGLEEGGRAL